MNWNEKDKNQRISKWYIFGRFCKHW